MHTVMASALINAGIRTTNSKLGRFYPGWNAKLSFSTYKSLTNKLELQQFNGK